MSARSKERTVPGGDSTYINTSADGEVKLREWTGAISKELVDMA